MLASTGAGAHDPSAYGGLFRSRDLGVTWLNADAGLFLNAALTVAVDPRDPAHLLIGTDLGVMRSPNGGRSWAPEAAGLILGAVFAVAFLADGGSAIATAPSGVFRLRDGDWAAGRGTGGRGSRRAPSPSAPRPTASTCSAAMGCSSARTAGRASARWPETLPDAAEITGLAVATRPAR